VLLDLAKSIALYATVIAAKAGRRAMASLAGYLVAAGLFVVSLCFLTLAGYRAMAQAMGEVYASLIVGCIYFVAGLVTILVVQFRRR
jgi:hypothetical protein